MEIIKEESKVEKMKIKKKQNHKVLVFNDEKIKNYEIIMKTFKNEDFTSLNLPSNKDLIPGQYEGGIKIWECSLDLCDFLPGYIGWYDLSNMKVLEVGCGHGLPGLYFLLKGSLVLYQDFNSEVLDKIICGYVNQIFKNYNIDLSNNVGFINGDWKEFIPKLSNGDFYTKSPELKNILSSCKYDIIISADTLYNIENYESFYEIIKNKLNNPGICFISSKKFYFGVGGGTSQFIDFVNNKNEFAVKVVKEINDGMSNIRQILELRLK